MSRGWASSASWRHEIYWDLARAIVAGDPYVVIQFGSPHYALRTPGYPLFLAACQAIFGENFARCSARPGVPGALSVWLVVKLARAVLRRREDANSPPGVDWVPVIAGLWRRFILIWWRFRLWCFRRRCFLPLMMLGLWGLARLWDKTKPVGFVWIASGTGLAMGGAILARPSWALFVPMVLASWVIGAGWGSRWRAVRGSVIVALATAAVLAPWWIRNERVIGRFVPTALWVGASLYDGISPLANGSSAMEFVEAPDVRSLGEVEQDALFRERSVDFARAHRGGSRSWRRSSSGGSGAPGRTPTRSARGGSRWGRRR